VALKFRELFLGSHPAFPRPLVGFGAGGYYCYVPMPFAKSCLVRMRAPKVQFYQINYALYGPETTVTTLNPQASETERAHRDRACALLNRAGTDLSRLVAPPDANVAASQKASSRRARPRRSFEPGRADGSWACGFPPPAPWRARRAICC
jgi:hypothetical protein